MGLGAGPGRSHGTGLGVGPVRSHGAGQGCGRGQAGHMAQGWGRGWAGHTAQGWGAGPDRSHAAGLGPSRSGVGTVETVCVNVLSHTLFCVLQPSKDICVGGHGETLWVRRERVLCAGCS